MKPDDDFVGKTYRNFLNIAQKTISKRGGVMKTKSNLNGFFPMRAVTVSAMAVTAILTFVLASCSPIAENERMSPLQPG